MGKYSELIGSFKRMGSFPMEANFIFENETALKDFYSSPEEAATLHKGLLKLVADSATGEQSLWWVTKKQTNDELEFTKLIDSTSVESLEELAEKLEKEIYDRQVADDAIYGSSDHTVVPEDLNSLLKIAEAIAELREAIKEDGGKVDTIKEELKATVGTELDDIREYLKTLDYQSLTAVSKELHRFLATREPDTDSIDTFPELLDFLAGFKDTDVLQDVLDTLVADIMGDPLPTEPFRTLRGIEDFVREFKAQSENTDANLQTELDQTQVGVGLSGDGAYNPDKETYYLKDATSVMNALKILDSLINEAINNCNLEVEDTNTVDLTINKQTTKTVLSADVKISTNDGNGIQAKNDGLFYKLETEYENGILTVKVNDNIISRHTIGLSTIVESAKYDPDQEAIIMVFKLLDGSKQELVIPVGTLIREWEVDNSHPTKVVVLEKEDVLGGGTDKLSADVRLYVDKYQILEKRDNTLYVKGTTDNLTHNDEALDVVIDRIISSGSDTNDALQAEIDRAKAAEQALDNKITAETTRADKVETQLRNDLDAEIKRATGVETDLQKQIDNLQDSTSTDISELEAALKAEVERSTEKDAAHDTAISEEVARATEAENQLRRDLTTTNEKVTANTANIEKNADAIAKETERATAAESSLSDGLRAEIERATTKETELEGAITTHINDTNNPHNVTKEQVGLGKVDNTTDLEKPVSVATQAALDTKADKTYVDAQLDTKAPIDSPVFKGNPQVENPPAPNDSSNRIPSTAWVNETIKNSVSDGLEAHIKDFNNPHKVTAEQTGAYTKEQVDGLLDTKADLIDGKIPTNQLPDSIIGGMKYMGTWSAKDNDPQLNNGDPTQDGWYYIVSEAGERFGEVFDVKDWVVNSKGTWGKIDNVDSVVSVNGKKGIVIIEIGDIPGLKDAIDKGGTGLEDHITDYNNPHRVTAEQVGSYTKEETNNLLSNKADLVNGIIPENQIPTNIRESVHYEGTWDAETNAPALKPQQPEANGFYYLVTVAGRFNGVDYEPGDLILNAGGQWVKIDNSDLVTSVNGMIGDVIINIQDIPGLEDKLNGAEGDFSKINKAIEEIRNNIINLTNNKADLEDGVVPENQLPETIKGCLKYHGSWNAADNDPMLSNDDVDKEGWYYIVSSAGTRFNNSFAVGDWVVNSGGTWTRVNNADAVISVNGQSGIVNIEIDDIPGLKDALDSTDKLIDDHIRDFNNPHKVTKDQIGLGKVENYSPAEMPISNAVQTEITRIDKELLGAATDLTAHIKDTNNPHQTTKEQVGLGKVDNTSDLEKPISVPQQNEFNRVDRELDKKALQTDLAAHVSDFNNPHHVTKEQVGLGKVDNTSDLEKPISIAVQEALNNIKIDATGYATKEELTNHINDKNNPHNVTKEQIGLGNVDNTSDMNKPISTATQMALDKKADVHHSHTMTDITDLENLPIIKGFVTVLSELPESATGGDKYIMSTQVGSGSTRYTLLEFDGATGTWKQKLLTTGGIAAVIDGDVWELTSKGIKRVLDADDYKYFYDKVWGETKDLVQSIEWDDTVSNKIRLKVTTKKSYADPNTDEATKPTVTPKVTYIDIEKERFMSSAYSRPATQEDVNNGYASKVGVPVLVIELTTGDEIVIDLTDTMNIYDPIDTSSINMEVSNWTGTAATSYKISATLKIAENSDAVKLVDNGTSGVYARLDKKNTNSIQMVDDGSLSANLVIDTAKNNLSDILLTIGAAGLSAQFIVGEYD